jgi:hypothetical protein
MRPHPDPDAEPAALPVRDVTRPSTDAAAPGTGAPDPDLSVEALAPEDRERVAAVLAAEYGLLAGMLSAVWSASLVRTSLFLAVLSAVGVALGFAAQAGGGFGATFTAFALVALPLALFLGVATFARTVEVQREAIVYITGMNRIRWFMARRAPGAVPYLVLSIHDDAAGVYRSQGTGIRLEPPRSRLVFALVQTQGIVAVTSAAIAGVIGALAAAMVSPVAAWVVGGGTFILVLAALFAYWNRSIAELQGAIRPLHPTPPEEGDRRI